MDKSPEGYGLRAINTPEGFSALGLDGEVWTVLVEDGEKVWVQNSEVDNSPVEENDDMKKILKRKAKAQHNVVHCKSRFLFLGDPRGLFNFAKAHSWEEFVISMTQQEILHPNKRRVKIADGLAYMSHASVDYTATVTEEDEEIKNMKSKKKPFFSDETDFCETPVKKKQKPIESSRKQYEPTNLNKKRRRDGPDVLFVEPTPPKKKAKTDKKQKIVNDKKQDFDKPIRSEPFFPELAGDVPILHQWFSVPRKLLTEEECRRHTDALSIVGSKVNYMTGKLPDPVPSYLLDDQFMHFPKHYGLKHFGSVYEDRQRYGLDTDRLRYNDDFPLDETVRKQKSAFEAIYATLTSEAGGALLALPPGDGKTTVACYTMSRIGKVTLVVVPADHIGEQWIERINQYLPDARIGTLQADVYDYEDKDVVICTIQSLYKDKYPAQILDRFGMVIVDECHHVSAKKFSRSLPLAACRYMLTLSGTPRRKDNADVLLSNWVGCVTFQTRRTYLSKVRVKVIQPRYPPIPEKYNQMGKHHFALMMNDLANCTERNEVIIQEIMTSIETKNQILVLSSRRAQLKYLAEKVEERLKDKNENVSIGFILGRGKKKDQTEARSCQVIFSTFPMSAEALDVPTLRIVMLCTPKPDVAQSVARVLRSKNPSVEPLIIDFLEKKSIWANFWYQRRKFYLSEGFELEFVDGEDIQEAHHFKSPRNVVYDGEEEAEEIRPKRKRKTSDVQENKPSRKRKTSDVQENKPSRKRKIANVDEPARKRVQKCPF